LVGCVSCVVVVLVGVTRVEWGLVVRCVFDESGMEKVWRLVLESLVL